MFRRPQFVTSLLRLAVCAALAVAGGCAGNTPLASTHPSPEALAAAVLDALARKDRPALDALALTEQEFREHVWPELPAARPERNLPFSYVWGDLHQKSWMSLAQTLERLGGRRFALVSVRFAGETDYPSYRVHRETTLRVRDTAGTETDIQVCGSMMEKNGTWKVFSYVVD